MAQHGRSLARWSSPAAGRTRRAPPGDLRGGCTRERARASRRAGPRRGPTSARCSRSHRRSAGPGAAAARPGSAPGRDAAWAATSPSRRPPRTSTRGPPRSPGFLKSSRTSGRGPGQDGGPGRGRAWLDSPTACSTSSSPATASSRWATTTATGRAAPRRPRRRRHASPPRRSTPTPSFWSRAARAGSPPRRPSSSLGATSRPSCSSGAGPIARRDPDTAARRRELQQAIMDRQRAAGGTLTPRAVRTELTRSWPPARCRHATLRATGARASYHCDVGDTGALGALVDSVYAEHGRIDGVVHGAGSSRTGSCATRSSRRCSGCWPRRPAPPDAGRPPAPGGPALPRPLQLGFRPLRQPRPGRLRGGQRGAQQAGPAARPPLGRPGRRDQLGPVGRHRHGQSRGRPAVRRARRRADPARGRLRPPRRGAAPRRMGEAEVLVGGVEDVPARPLRRARAARARLLPARPARSPAATVALEVIRRLEPEHDRLLDDHRLDGRRCCRSPGPWSSWPRRLPPHIPTSRSWR